MLLNRPGLKSSVNFHVLVKYIYYNNFSIEVSRETTRDGFDPFDAESSQSMTLTTNSSMSQAQQYSVASEKQELSFSNLHQNDNYILPTVSDDDITLQGINYLD